MLGLTDTFGAYQRSIDIGIDLAILSLKEYERVLPDVDESKLDIFLQSIRNLRKAHNKARLIKQIAEKS